MGRPQTGAIRRGQHGREDVTTDELLSYCVARAKREAERAGPQCQNEAAAKRAREWLLRAERVRDVVAIVAEAQADEPEASLPFEIAKNILDRHE